jgi:2-polyprenyl-3-methyl-5-hydroxy-6-metoxy-1,4-benzoquinol methylase
VSAPYSRLVARRGLSPAHRLALAAVPDGARVLDVGCATGYLARELAARGCRVVGVESDPSAAAAAREHCELVVVGDVEDSAVRDELPREMDVLLAADVLEHLRDPWEALAALRETLAGDGRAVVSIPNVGHWSARRELARGRFSYTEHGLFDRTHLRFFTRAAARELTDRAGFAIVAERFAASSLPFEPYLRRRLGGTEHDPPPWLAAARARLVARWPELFALQFVLTLRPR